MTYGSLMKVESIAECSLCSIPQYFWPGLSDNWLWKTIFCLFESGRFTQVLLYTASFENSIDPVLSSLLGNGSTHNQMQNKE